MSDFTEVFYEEIKNAFESSNGIYKVTDTTVPEYATMKYPKLLPMMKFTTKRYRVAGFGSVMVMSTKAMGGLMKLLTVSFTPFEGADMPFLLIDCMSMKKKKLAYVEYYDCTSKALDFENLNALCEKYRNVPDYDEKPAWYVKERMKCSLIKGGSNVNEDDLLSIVKESFSLYMNLTQGITRADKNIEGLKKFQNRMLTEGNPSEGTMSKVLGKEGQEVFFKSYVMPLE